MGHYTSIATFFNQRNPAISMSLPSALEIASLGEGPNIDFKQVHHRNTAELLHDILCLSNSLQPGPRWLVYGVADNGSIIGVQGSSNRRSNADLRSFLDSCPLERRPEVSLTTLIEGQAEIDVLQIEDEPHKPFTLVEDWTKEGKTVRAGVVYTRSGDTNTPINGCAPRHLVEAMWRQTLRLDVLPIEAFDLALEDTNGWIRDGELGEELMHYESNPNLVIKTGRTINADFKEDWSASFPDSHAESFYVELVYDGTTIEKLAFVTCDEFRYKIPMPEIDPTDDQKFIATDSRAFKLAQLFDQRYPLWSALPKSVELR